MVIRYGQAGILVTRNKSNSRPYWTVYQPNRILGWRFGEHKGQRSLVQLRLEEHVQVPSGKYGVQTVRQVRFLEPGKWTLYREVIGSQSAPAHRPDFAMPYGAGGGTFEVVDQGRFPFSDIPFSVAYADIEDFEMLSSPPLRPLAEADALLYALGANRKHLLNLCAVPVMAVTGRETDEGAHRRIGPSYVMQFQPNTTVQWLETSGVSFKAVQEQITEIERDIDTLGMTSVVNQKASAETATAKQLDHIDGSTVMSVVSQNLERAINQSAKYHTLMLGLSLDPFPRFSLDRDFTSMKLLPNEITSLTSLVNEGLITKETLLELLKDGYVLPAHFDSEEELKKIAQEKADEMDLQLLDRLGQREEEDENSSSEESKNGEEEEEQEEDLEEESEEEQQEEQEQEREASSTRETSARDERRRRRNGRRARTQRGFG